MLLLGSYPSEVSANLSLEKLDPGQPTTVQGHDFYSGRLERRRVVLGISDTTAVGNLWPFEWLVYQQLAADNAAVAARLWIGAWGVRAAGVGAART